MFFTNKTESIFSYPESSLQYHIRSYLPLPSQALQDFPAAPATVHTELPLSLHIHTATTVNNLPGNI